MTDTEAGTPLTAAIEAAIDALTEQFNHKHGEDWSVADAGRNAADKAVLDAHIAALDAARSRPATDPAGLDVAEWARWIIRQGRNPDRACPECGPTAWGVAPKRCVPHEALARLAVADGPGPEERPDLEAAARAVRDNAVAGWQPMDNDFERFYRLLADLSAALPERREEPSR